MSTGDSGPGTREVAYRLFAAEFNDCSLSYAESDDERAPNFVVTPTGLRVNRLFSVGVLTETEAVNDETLRGRLSTQRGHSSPTRASTNPRPRRFSTGRLPRRLSRSPVRLGRSSPMIRIACLRRFAQKA